MITRKIGPDQGELVLLNPGSDGTGQPGSSNRAPEIADAACQTGTSPIENRAPTAAATARTAAMASAEPAGPGSTGSGVRSRHHPVNTERTASTRPAKRRSQPRIVAAGRPSSAAINRCPAPVAFAVKPAPITAAVSARRTSNTALPHSPAKDNTGRAVAYPDPKTATVAAPINEVNATRSLPSASAHSTARVNPASSSMEAVNIGGGPSRSSVDEARRRPYAG
jgi:hypothetical protein